MSKILDQPGTRSTDSPREFMVSVELFIPATASLGLRKPTTSRRKAVDGKGRGRAPEEFPKKIKEKSSWMSLARSAAESGKWRPSICKILDEDDNCSLNIYVDETILYQTIYVHMLNHTDIRHADPSLFLRKNCIGISSAGGQRWSSAVSSEPIYLHFDDPDACSTWLVLLRSYAKPEIYGQPFIPFDGGLYRMWRQVELTIIQGRDIGSQKPFVDVMSSSATLGEDIRAESDPADSTVFCEVYINDNLCGRTTVKGIGTPDWHERFTFSDLPPFEALEISLWKEKRLVKPMALGSVRVALTNFRRGEDVEGWFPLTQSSGGIGRMQAGDIRMKLKVDEEIILPHTCYSGLLTVLHARNVLEWMKDFERKLQLRALSEQLICVAIAKNVLVEHITEYVDCEVDGTSGSHNTIFRGNTIFTKTMELAMEFYGRAFLEASIGQIIRRLCSEKIAIEVDPVRSGKGSKDVERGVEQLIEWCQAIWDSIYANRGNCPPEMRKLFEHVRKLVESRYKGGQGKQRDLPYQGVSAFCFLRFIVPAILYPHLFGLYPGIVFNHRGYVEFYRCPGLPGATVQRSLTLIAKVIQSLANLNAVWLLLLTYVQMNDADTQTVQRETFMQGVKHFLQRNLSAMVDYILVISSPAPDAHSTHSGQPAFSHQRLTVVNTLHQRGATLPVLDREAIPLLPHVLDIPRHLACICSYLLRSARLASSRSKSFEGADHLVDLCAKCFEVEEVGLQRVSQLPSAETQLDISQGGNVGPAVTQEGSSSLHTSPIGRGRWEGFRPASLSVNLSPPLHDTHRHSTPVRHTPRDLPSIRRGSVPDIRSQEPTYPEPQMTSRRRFLRAKSISADSISTFVSRTTMDTHTPSPSVHSSGRQDLSVGEFDESSRKSKNVLNGLLTRR
ncbi:Rho GTPase activation protein [Phlebopus sp. FC_14]|nr:Rho GTPase activation protein [Phlebopus sp. FC_14]